MLRGGRVHRREDVRVPADEFVDQARGDVVEGPALLGGQLLGESGVEGDLEQHVAEFLAQRVGILLLDGGVGLVALLEQVRREGEMGLLRVPGTAAGRAEPVHHGHHVEQPSPGQIGGAVQHLDLDVVGAGQLADGPYHCRVAVLRSQPDGQPGGRGAAPDLLSQLRCRTAEHIHVDTGSAQGGQLRMIGGGGAHRAVVQHPPRRP